jgi:cell division protein FtsW (lipid II flippase)
MSRGDRWKRANWTLLALALLLTGLGIATISTATEGMRTGWAWMQARWVVVAVAGCLLAFATPYRRIVQSRWALYGLGLALLVLVLFKGTGQSAGRWIGVGAFRMQPSEFMKVILVVTLAGMLRYERSHYRLKGLLGPLAVTLVPVALVMKQPDLGTALLLVPLLFAILFAAGARVRHLGVIAGLGVLAGLAMFFVPGILHDYQKDRVLAFITEHTDSQAAVLLRQSQGHQLHNGLVAAGLGGLAGVAEEDGGVAAAVREIPERHSDFVFPVFAARYGFLGVTVLLALYALFLGALLATAQRVREPSGRLLIVGAFTLLASQVVVNLGMTLGLLPVVGVTLPFFSYGGSSLLTTYIALGLAMNVGADPPVEFGKTTYEAR